MDLPAVLHEGFQKDLRRLTADPEQVRRGLRKEVVMDLTKVLLKGFPKEPQNSGFGRKH
jgi:hypothetical protein